MLWTLTFVMFLMGDQSQVSGGVFKSKASCEAIRAQLLEAQESKALPDRVHSLVVGSCQIWMDPKAGLNP